jgi:uncharacterized glyoxalase superfamily protein PhnB
MAQTVIPYLLYEDGEAAIEFAARAFGFREVERTAGGAGGLHAELEVAPGSARIYLGQPPSGFRNPKTVGRTSLVYVLVDDVDTHFDRAKVRGHRDRRGAERPAVRPSTLRLHRPAGPRVVLRAGDCMAQWRVSRPYSDVGRSFPPERRPALNSSWKAADSPPMPGEVVMTSAEPKPDFDR